MPVLERTLMSPTFIPLELPNRRPARTTVQLDLFGSPLHVIPSTGVTYEAGPASTHCDMCDCETVPIPLSDPDQGWIPLPCHQTECATCFAYETHCGNCDYCEDCCECVYCARCSEVAEHGVCSGCDLCRDCCDCYICGHCDVRDRYGEGFCFECDLCTSCCACPTSCECESAHQSFTFPANGAGTVANDERLAVDSPSGTISGEGMRAIANLVHGALRDEGKYNENGYGVVMSLDPVWQAKRGNFPRRLSSELHRKLGAKLAPEVLSEVGNLARAHTSSERTNLVEFTRQLNMSAADFYNDESCWWGSHSFSRCSFKELGGIGMRTFSHSFPNEVLGRAWVQPLDSAMQPTDNAIGAHAYVIYNGYGDLAGYEPARIVAYLTGRTYAKIDLTIHGQYVNGNKGFLIADQATCDKVDSLTIDGEANSDHR